MAYSDSRPFPLRTCLGLSLSASAIILKPCASSQALLILKRTAGSLPRSRRFPARSPRVLPRRKPRRESRPLPFMHWWNGSSTGKMCLASTTSFLPQRHDRLTLGQGNASLAVTCSPGRPGRCGAYVLAVYDKFGTAQKKLGQFFKKTIEDSANDC